MATQSIYNPDWSYISWQVANGHSWIEGNLYEIWAFSPQFFWLISPGTIWLERPTDSGVETYRGILPDWNAHQHELISLITASVTAESSCQLYVTPNSTRVSEGAFHIEKKKLLYSFSKRNSAHPGGSLLLLLDDQRSDVITWRKEE